MIVSRRQVETNEGTKVRKDGGGYAACILGDGAGRSCRIWMSYDTQLFGFRNGRFFPAHFGRASMPSESAGSSFPPSSTFRPSFLSIVTVSILPYRPDQPLPFPRGETGKH